MWLPKIAFPPRFLRVHTVLAPVIENSYNNSVHISCCWWLFCVYFVIHTYLQCRLQVIYARRSPREITSPPAAAFIPGPISNITVSCELRCRNHTESSELSCHFLRSFRTNVRFSPPHIFILADKQQDTALLCCFCLALGTKLLKMFCHHVMWQNGKYILF